MKSRRLIILMICCLGGTAHGELEPPGYEIRGRISSWTVDSLEWTAADSDLIVRARMADRTKIEGRWATWHLCRAQVIETLKGPDLKEATFVAWGGATWPECDEWLLFLKRRTEYGAGSQFKGINWELRQHGGQFGVDAWQAVPLDGNGAVETIDRKYLTLRGDILGALAEVMRASAGVPRPRSMLLSNFSPWGGSDPSEIWTPALRVPLDAQMQKQARAWTRLRIPRDPDNAFPFFRARENKLEAIHILSIFRSEQNIAALRGMLDDPYPDEGNQSVQRLWSSRFSPRYRAWEVLCEWGERVERPVCETPADLYRPATRSLVGVLLLLCAAGLAMWRRPAWFLAGVGVMVLLLGWRSAWRVDALVWAPRSWRWDLVSFRGEVQFSLPMEWEHSGPLAYFTFVPENGNEVRNWDTSRMKTVWKRWGIRYAAEEWYKPRRMVVVPHGWVAGVCSLGLVGSLARAGVLRLRRRARRRGNRCEGCGYDLRGSGGRCPECGRERGGGR